MTNPLAGKIARDIAAKKRPRSFWNLFFSACILITLWGMSVFVYEISADRITYYSAQTFVEYKDGCLKTDIDSFKIPDPSMQEISIREFIKKVNPGEEIELTISSLSHNIIEISYSKKIVYQKKINPIAPTVIGFIVLFIPMLSVFVFMLVVTNTKNPGPKIDKIQKQFLLRRYK